MRGPLLTALKAGTAESHRRLEALVPLSRVPLAVSDYVEYLRTMAAFVPAAEARVFAWDWAAAGLADADGRRHATRLASDLAVFGEAVAFPDDAGLPAFADRDEALGALYVLEGSTLGGQVLARRLAALGPDPLPLTYLTGAGAATGERWLSFCRFAEAHAEGRPERIASAVRGAQATFEALARLFERRATTGGASEEELEEAAPPGPLVRRRAAR